MPETVATLSEKAKKELEGESILAGYGLGKGGSKQSMAEKILAHEEWLAKGALATGKSV